MNHLSAAAIGVLLGGILIYRSFWLNNKKLNEVKK